MSEISTTQEHEQFTASQEGQVQGVGQSIGLDDGNFLVQRSKDARGYSVVETGWSVESFADHAAADGYVDTYANIVKTEDDGRVLEKTVPVNVLLGWQPKPETVQPVAERALSGLELAQAKFNEAHSDPNRLSNMMILGDPELDAAVDALTPAERQKFDSWQVEGAANRTPSIWEVIAVASKDPSGRDRYVLDAEQSEQFEHALTKYGLSMEAPDEESIAAGITRAKQTVASGQAANVLAAEEFISDRDPRIYSLDKPKGTTVDFEGAMYIDPALIKGTSGHQSWAGRGNMGAESVNIRELNNPAAEGGVSSRSSISQIEDYATRDTQLPELTFGIDMYLTKDGPIFMSPNAHRVSAAKLRGEPLKIEMITIHNMQ